MTLQATTGVGFSDTFRWAAIWVPAGKHKKDDGKSSTSVGTVWLFNIAMGNGPFIDGLPIKHGDFPWLR